MDDGFFPASELISNRVPLSLVPKCGACGLYKTCRSKKMQPTGRGRRNILIVGEAPGRDEDAQGRQFVGVTGQRLRDGLRRAGIDMVRDCVLTNAVICRPPDNTIDDNKVIDYCRPNLLKTIKDVNPEIIVLLGQRAVKSLLGYYWREDVGGMAKWTGWKIPHQKTNAWIFPIYHPSYIMRLESSVADKYFDGYLEQVAKTEGRPWDKVPDFKSKVEVLISTNAAAKRLQRYNETPCTITFDYETDRLKPDHPDSRIVCCSVCWEGKETIAFPWAGKTIAAMRDLLRNPSVLKMGYNQKFETRWTLRHLKCSIRGWVWDGMDQAHVLDNRKGIAGLKFQAFVRLGQDPWNKHIEPFLKAEGGNTQNRIHEVGWNDLLLYCGMDSLLEYRVGKIQMREFRRKFLTKKRK